jgi:hypothetical protein
MRVKEGRTAGMFIIYEDDYAQTPFPDLDSDGAVELYWDHPNYPEQWSGRFCPSYPYDNWGRVVPLKTNEGCFGVWGVYNIIMGHFGLLGRVEIPFAELCTLSPDELRARSARSRE